MNFMDQLEKTATAHFGEDENYDLMESLAKTASGEEEDKEENEEVEEGTEATGTKEDVKETGKAKAERGNEINHEEAGAAKSASDLMESLEKTAANLKGTLGDASGKAYNSAKKSHNQMAKGFNKANTPKGLEANAKGVGIDNGGVAKSRQNLEAMQKEVGKSSAGVSAAKSKRDEARGKLAPAAVTGAAAAGAAGGAAATKQRQEQQKTAGELMDSLEKTASGVLAGLKGTLGAASGKGYNSAKKSHDQMAKGYNKANTPKGLEANAKGIGIENGGVAKARQNLESMQKEVGKSATGVAGLKATRDQARGQLAPAAITGAAAAGAAGGVAATNAKNNQEEEQKTASGEFMNEMYKEAATSILEMHIPEVKAYKDPMDGISFRR